MVFYFSGTGNSEHVAKCMGDPKVVNISEASKKGEFSYNIGPGERVGFVMPVYYAGVPKTVLEFVRKIALNGSIEYLYSIFTHGGGAGGAGTMLRRELKKRGYPYHACFDVKMASNYIMFGDLGPDEKIISQLKESEPLIEQIKSHVEKKEQILPPWTAMNSFLTSCMKGLCDNYLSVKRFHADSGCTGCGKCVRNCPSGLIEMENGRPVWAHKKCVRCMSCLQCEHVQFNKDSCNRRRYSFEKYSKL